MWTNGRTGQQYTRKEIYNMLIEKKQIKKLSTIKQKWQAEYNDNYSIIVTKAGYLKAIVNDANKGV